MAVRVARAMAFGYQTRGRCPDRLSHAVLHPGHLPLSRSGDRLADATGYPLHSPSCGRVNTRFPAQERELKQTVQ
jgi:hypothetical protein